MNRVIWLVGMSFAVLYPSSSLGSMNPYSIDEGCQRYRRILEQPGAIERLEGWYRSLPHSIERRMLIRGSGAYRMTQFELAPTFDAESFGLRPDVQVPVILDEDGSLVSLYITDQRGVAFVFRVDDDVEAFNEKTLAAPRGQRVGIFCSPRD